jgi:hypothetical protein
MTSDQWTDVGGGAGRPGTLVCVCDAGGREGRERGRWGITRRDGAFHLGGRVLSDAATYGGSAAGEGVF